MKEPFCKNCLLYDWERRLCRVVVIHDGGRMNPPTDPDTRCIFEEEYETLNEKGEVERWKPEVKEIKMWVEDPNTGKKGKKGVVKIEYPEELFSDQFQTPGGFFDLG